MAIPYDSELKDTLLRQLRAQGFYSQALTQQIHTMPIATAAEFEAPFHARWRALPPLSSHEAFMDARRTEVLPSWVPPTQGSGFSHLAPNNRHQASSGPT